MADTKNIHKKIKALILVLCGLLTASSGYSQIDFINHTSYKDVKQFCYVDDTLFAVTSGGLLIITDPQQPGMQLTNNDGFGTNDLTDMIVDADGVRWITGFGRLIRYDLENPKQYLFFNADGDLFGLNTVVDDGDNLWIGTDRGLVLFSKTNDDGQIEDSYELFGNLNPSPVVRDITLRGDEIWLGTSEGVAVAKRTQPNLLKLPSSWTGLSVSNYPELRYDIIENIISFESEIYLGNIYGIFRFDADSLSGDTTFTAMPQSGIRNIVDLRIDYDTLFYYTIGGTGYIKNGTVTYLPATGLSTFPLTGVHTGNYSWVSLYYGGGLYYGNPGSYTLYPYIGLPGNELSDIAVDMNGRLLAGFERRYAGLLEDSVWTMYNLNIANASSIIFDQNNNGWIGTVGDGMWLLDGDTLIHYDTTNSSMRGNNDNPPSSYTFIIPLDMVINGDFLYIGCYKAYNGYPIAIADLNNLNNPQGWDSIGVSNGLGDTYVVSIDYYDGVLAVATETDGIYLCEVGDDPNSANITCQHLTRENSLLISNSVRVLRYSPEGVLWAGTNFGLSRYNIGTDRFNDIILPSDISSDVAELEFDGRGNLWIGTKDGLAYRDDVTGEIDIYNTLNSGLVTNSISKITVDSLTGDVYIATKGGFSYVPNYNGIPEYDINQILAFPNPYVISNGEELVQFNFNRSGEIKIYNIAGELVREMPLAAWDGKNQKGAEVASGVYIFVITDVEGNVGTGKFLLVRN